MDFFFQYRKKKWNAQIFKAKRNARGLLETNLFFFFSLTVWSKYKVTGHFVVFSDTDPYKEETNMAIASMTRDLQNWLDMTLHENHLFTLMKVNNQLLIIINHVLPQFHRLLKIISLKFYKIAVNHDK